MGLTKRPNPGTRTDVRAPSSTAIHPLTLALAALPPALRGSWRNLPVNRWASLPAKRTKGATKRTSDPVEMRDTEGRALHSISRDMACLRPRRLRADTTFIDTITAPVWPPAGHFRKQR